MDCLTPRDIVTLAVAGALVTWVAVFASWGWWRWYSNPWRKVLTKPKA